MKFSSKGLLGTVAAVCCLAGSPVYADVPLLSEGFDSATLPAGWTRTNFSDNPASEAWFQPLVSDFNFAAQAGANAGSYLATSVFTGATNAAGEPTGRIDNFLGTPVISLAKATTLTFWTRTISGNAFGESLQVGAIVGGSYIDLLTINPTFAVGAYPESWTQYTVSLPAQGAAATGLFYFEYIVPDASVAGNFIGIDTVTVAVSAVPEPSSRMLLVVGAFACLALCRRARPGQRNS